MAKISWDDKEDYRDLGAGIPAHQKFISIDANEVKASVNALYDMLTDLRVVRWVPITAVDFGGSNYQNPDLIGLTAGIDFNMFTNDGSGTLLRPGAAPDGDYTFVSSTGTITTTPGNYKLQILLPVS